jgi:hypothetical protein
MSRSAILKNKNKTFSFFLPKPGDYTSPVGRGTCMIYDKVFVYKYKEVDKFATVIR